MFDEIYDNIILQDAVSPDGRFKLVSPHSLIDTLDDSDPPQPYMMDTPEERLASKEFVEQAKGQVLQFGLGIGLTVKALEKKEEVDFIVVIEKNKWVIEEISAQLQFSEKVKIIHADAFTYEPDQKFDSIFIDLSTPGWELDEYKAQGLVHFDYDTRIQLVERYTPYLNEGGWINYFKKMELPANSDGK